MTAKEYFGDYWKCVDKQELDKVIKQLKVLYNTKLVCPHLQNVFKAFELCPYNKLKVIILGEEPYAQKNVATGLAFANKASTEILSPSLEVLKETVINFEKPHNYINFVPDLKEWAKQGVLLLNSSLTVEVNKKGSHINMWRPFIGNFLHEVSLYNPSLIYVLLGKHAQSFKCYISNHKHIIEEKHPSYYARVGKKMPYSIFTDINKHLAYYYNTEIIWFNEIKY